MTTTAGALDLPFDEAIAFFRQKTAVPTKSRRDVWDAAHSKMFMVAGANSKALVKDFQDEIAKALETGSTLADFRKGFDGIIKKHGWSYNGDRGWRTRTIFETNLSTAYNAGRYAQLTEPDTLATFPGWQYNHSGALHPRLDHKSWDGQIYPANDPVWKVMFTPNGYGCHCFITPVSMSRLRRIGKKGFDTPPDLSQVGTDQPRGIDPSFAYNPGEAWLKHAAPGPMAVAADEANVAAFVRSALAEKWPDGAWTPSGVTGKALPGNFAKKGDELRLHAETIRENRADEATTPAAYGTIPRRLLKTGKVTPGVDGRALITGEVEGQTWELHVQAASDPSRHLRILKLKRIGSGA